MKSEHLIFFLAALAVVLSICICVLSLWQPPAAAVMEFSSPTAAPTEEATEPTETSVSTMPSVTETATVPPTTEPTVHEHDYTGKVTKSPACTASGVRTYTCECGASYQENIQALPHAYVIAVQNPTCIQNGYTTYTCKNCGYSYMELGDPALGHSFGPWSVKKAPTETTTGLAERQCTRCHTSETVALPSLG